jgi:hypothetical protein
MNHYSDYFDNYIKQTQGETAVEALEDSTSNCLAVLSSITEEQGDFRYAPDKWTVKEVIGHINDTERILSYRALRFASHDQTELAGYDENIYAKFSNADNRTVGGLVDEFEALRKATLIMYQSFSESTLACTGSANGLEVDVNRLGYVLAGHSLHHSRIITERYLINQ